MLFVLSVEVLLVVLMFRLIETLMLFVVVTGFAVTDVIWKVQE